MNWAEQLKQAVTDEGTRKCSSKSVQSVTD